MDSGGMPVTGSVPVTFVLWDGETAGTMLWTESKAVEVSGGLYSVLLGDSVAIPASVFAGSAVYLEVTVLGETLEPRQRLTAVPYAFHSDDADNLGGVAAAGYSLVGHTHDFSEITGTATDAQIPDNITINLAQNSSELNGLLADAYVLAAGDTVTGNLQVNGALTGLGSLTVGSDLYVITGQIGLGTSPAAGFGILNSALAPPTYGAYLYGSLYGVRGAWSTDTYGILGKDGIGVYGNAGNSSVATPQYGGQFFASSASSPYGVYSEGHGYANYWTYGFYGYANNSSTGNVTGGQFEADNLGTGTHYGVAAISYSASSSPAYGTYSYASNASTGPAYAGYFFSTAGGTGPDYGIYASGGDYAGWFQDGKVHIGSGGSESYVSGDGDLYVQNVVESDGGIYAQGDPQGVFGAYSGDPDYYNGYLGTSFSGVFGSAGKSTDTGTKYGGYFQATADDYVYGVNAAAYGYTVGTSYGVYGFAANYSSGTSYGGFFNAGNTGTGAHYGVLADAAGTTSNGVVGASGYGNNLGSGNAYGGYFTAATSGSGAHYGVYGVADGYPVYAENSADSTVTAYLGRTGNAVYGKTGDSSSLNYRYGGEFIAASSNYTYGVFTQATGYGTSSTTGLYSYAYNSNSSATVYGAYLYAYANSGNQYGLYVANGTKNWVNPDPEDPTKSIVYATLEGGENGTYWRGTARLTNGYAVVEMPDHFRKATSPDYPVTVTVSPLADCNGLYIVSKSNERIEVKELNHGTSNAPFDFIIMGKRLGYEEYQPIIDNVDYVPFQGNLSNLDDSEITTQDFYDHQSPGLKKIFELNGTLDKNGKVNEETFRKKRWKDVKVRRN